MSKIRKKLIACAVAVGLGMSLGILAGLRVAELFGAMRLELMNDGSQMVLSHFSAAQLAHADAVHARAAALLEIEISDKLHRADPNTLNMLPLAYGRLAIAEEKLGDHDSAHHAFNMVRQLQKHNSAHVDLTDDQIERWVLKLNSAGF